MHKNGQKILKLFQLYFQDIELSGFSLIKSHILFIHLEPQVSQPSNL